MANRGRRWHLLLVGVLLLGSTIPTPARSSSDSMQQWTLLETNELASERNAYTRAYESVYSVPTLDESGNPTEETREVRRRHYVKASGLNYDIQDYESNPTGSSIWVPAISRIVPSAKEGVAFEVETGNAKVYFSGDITATYNLGYRIGKDTLRTGVVGIAYYDRATRTRTMLRVPQASTPVVEGNRLVYAGAFPGADIEYVYRVSSFHTNLVIHDLTALPNPAIYGMDPETTFLVLVQRLDLDGCGRKVYRGQEEFTGDSAFEGPSLRLDFRRADGKVIHYLARGNAWDNSGSFLSFTPVYKRLVKSESSCFLLEGVSYSWLASEERVLPITVDPVQVDKSGDFEGREVWKSGVTYSVTDTFRVAGNGSLLVEGGAIIKIGEPGTRDSEGLIEVNESAVFKSLGGPHNYAVITSANDSTVGYSLPGAIEPAMGDYNAGIAVYSNNPGSVLRYMKIRYPKSAGVGAQDVSLQAHIEHNIVRDCEMAGIVVRSSTGTTSSVTIANNLVSDAGPFSVGIGTVTIGSNAVLNANIYNNTIDNYGIHGIWVAPHSTSENLTDTTINVILRNNLITNCAYRGVTMEKWAEERGHSINASIEYNGFYNNGTDIYTDWSQEFQNNEFLSVTPYDMVYTTHGRHYLNQEAQGGGRLRDAGLDLNLGLEAKTVDAPIEVTRQIRSTHWTKRDADEDGNDIGYHQDRVDYVIGSSALTCRLAVTGTLIIDPGVVISYFTPLDESTDASARIEITGTGGRVEARGLPGEMIEFNSLRATSQFVSAPGDNGDYASALYLNGKTCNESYISHCRFQHGRKGVRLGQDVSLRQSIRNCIFRHISENGIKHSAPNRIVNNAFVGCGQYGVYVNLGDPTSEIEANTFDDCALGVFIDVDELTAVVLRNNVFLNSGCYSWQAWVNGMWEGSISSNGNVYWNNGDLPGGNLAAKTFGGPDEIEANPIFVSSAEQLCLVSMPDAYLSQRLGDYSRRPLRVMKGLHADDGIGSATGLSPDQDFVILVGIDDEIPDIDDNTPSQGDEYIGKLNESGNYVPGASDENGPVWVTVYSKATNGTTIDEGARFTLRFLNDSTSVVYLPECELANGERIGFWVAEDGSTYYGMAGHSIVSGTSETFDQDSLYALRYSPMDLAQSGQAHRIVENATGSNHAGSLGQGQRRRWSELVHGKHGTALEFDGLDDCVDFGTIDLGTDFTYEAWIKPASNTGVILGREDAGVLRLADGHPVFDVGSKMVEAADSINLNVWTHVAATVDGGTATLYVQGKVAGATTNVSPSSSVATLLGASSSLNTFFAGLIDDVRLSDEALAVTALWHSGAYDVPLSATVSTAALWDLNDSPAVGNGYTEAYNYGTTALEGDPDWQKPDAGYHQFGSRLYSDDGERFQFTWEPPGWVTGSYSYWMHVEEVGEGGYSSGWQSIEEDGAFEPGEQLEDGEYVFTLKAVAGDSVDDASMAVSGCTVIVDTTPPTGGVLLVDDSDPHILAATDENGQVQEIIYGVDAMELRLEARFGEEANPWKVRFSPGFDTLDPVIVDASPYTHTYHLSQEDYETDTIEVVFYDGAGNGEVVTIPQVTYHEDYVDEDQSPTLLVYEPQPEATQEIEWTSGSKNAALEALLSFTAEDAAGSGVRFYGIHIEGSDYALTAKTDHFPWPTGPVADGTYTLVFSATDWAGNDASTTRTVNVIPGPLASVVIVPDGTSLTASKDPPQSEEFSVNGFDANGKPVTLQSNGIQWTLDGGDPVQGATFEFTASESGRYSLHVRAVKQGYDGENHVAEDTVLIRVVGDDEVWFVEIEPPKEVILGPGGSHQFTARATDWHGNVIPAAPIEWSIVDGPGTVSAAGLYLHPEDQLAWDGQTAVVKAAYAEDPESANDTAMVTFDVSPPTVYFLEPADEEIVKGTESLVRWHINDERGFSYSLVLDSCVTLAEGVGFPPGGRNFSETWNTELVIDGYHALEVIAVDTVGNTASDSVALVVNNLDEGVALSIKNGLQWLIEHQKTAGYWDEELDVAGTALSIRALTELGADLTFDLDRAFLCSKIEPATDSSSKDLAFSMIAGEGTYWPVLGSRQHQDGWWGENVGDATPHVYTTALASLSYLIEEGTPETKSVNYLKDLIQTEPESIETTRDLGLTLFTLCKADVDVADVSQGFSRLLAGQENDGGYGDMESTAWAVLALVESATYSDEYGLLGGMDYLVSYASGRQEMDRDNDPIRNVALALWALVRCDETYFVRAGIVDSLSDFLIAHRGPANYTESTSGERGWRNFEENFSVSMMVLRTLRVFRESEWEPFIDQAIIGSSTWPGAESWYLGDRPVLETDSTEHLSRKADSIFGSFPLDRDRDYSHLDALLGMLLYAQYHGVESHSTGGYGERISLINENVDFIDSALSLTNLAYIADPRVFDFPFRPPFDSALLHTIRNRLGADGAQPEAGGWTLSENILSPTSEIYTTALALMALKQLQEREQLAENLCPLGDPISLGAAWLADQRILESTDTASFNHNVVDSALAYLALVGSSEFSDDRAKVFQYIRETQLGNGSWNNRPLDTALALLVLHYNEPPDFELGPNDVVADIDGENVVVLTLTIENKSAISAYYGGLEVGLFGQNPDEVPTPPLGTYSIPDATYDVQSSIDIEIPLSEFGYSPPTGTKKIHAKLDPQNRITEEDETNNTSDVNLLLQTTVDLVAYAERISFASQEAAEKSLIVTSGTFINRGGIIPATDVNYRLRLLDEDGPILASCVGASTEDTRIYTIDEMRAVFSEGEFPVYLELDPDNIIPELCEVNNAAGKTLTVPGRTGTLDSDLAVRPWEVTLTPSRFEAGEFATLHVLVKNLGSGITSSSTDDVIRARIWDNDLQIGDTDPALRYGSDGVRPGDYAFLSLGCAFTPGPHEIRILVDPDRYLANDYNRANNEIVKRLYVRGEQNEGHLNLGFGRSDIEFYPPAVLSGQAFDVTATVHNLGGMAADDDILVSFYFGDPDSDGVHLTDKAIELSEAEPLLPGATAKATVNISSQDLNNPDPGTYEICASIPKPYSMKYSDGYEYEESLGATYDNVVFGRITIVNATADIVLNAKPICLVDSTPSNEEAALLFGVMSAIGEATSFSSSIYIYDESTTNYLSMWGDFPFAADQNAVVQYQGLLPAGEHNVRLVADPMGEVAEADESNNAATATLFVSGAELPDLAVFHNDFKPDTQNDLKVFLDPEDQTVVISALIHNYDDPETLAISDTVRDASVNFYYVYPDETFQYVDSEILPVLAAGNDVAVGFDTGANLGEIDGVTIAVCLDRTYAEAIGEIAEIDDATNNVAEVLVSGEVGAPTNVIAIPGDAMAKISWEKPEGVEEAAIAGYKLYLDKASDVLPSGTPQTFAARVENITEHSFTGLENLVEYVVGVSTVSTVGLESGMALACFMPMAKPVITHVNGEEVFPSEAKLVIDSTADLQIMASPGVILQLYRNGVACGTPETVGTSGIVVKYAVPLETSGTAPQSNVFKAIAQDASGEFFSQPSDPVNVVYDVLWDVAVYAEGISFQADSCPPGSTGSDNPIPMEQLPNYRGEQIYIVAWVRSLHGAEIPAASNDVRFVYKTPNGSTDTIGLIEGVALGPFEDRAVLMPWTPPTASDEKPLIDEIIVKVDDANAITNEVSEDNNTAILPIYYDPKTHFGREFWLAWPNLGPVDHFEEYDPIFRGYIYVYLASGSVEPVTIEFNKELEYKGQWGTEFVFFPPQVLGTHLEFELPGREHPQKTSLRICDATPVISGEAEEYSYVEDKGIHITSTRDIMVEFCHIENVRVDSFRALPVDFLADEYYLSTYSCQCFGGTEAKDYSLSVTVVAVEDGTTEVTVDRPDSATPEVEFIEKGQTFTYYQANSLTGTQVTADKKIAVMSADYWASIPSATEQTCCCDPMTTFVLPKEYAGKYYATAPLPSFPGKTGANSFTRIVATEDDTSVTVSDSTQQYPPYTLHAGDAEEIEDDAAYIIESNKRIMVYQYAKSSCALRECTSEQKEKGDPNVIIQYPVNRFTRAARLAYAAPMMPSGRVPPMPIEDYFTIFVDGDPQSSILIDDVTPIASSEWQKIAGTEIRFATYRFPMYDPVSVEDYCWVEHSLTNRQRLPFMVYAHGYGHIVSYGLPAGLGSNPGHSLVEDASPDLTVSEDDICLPGNLTYGVDVPVRISVHNLGESDAENVKGEVQIYDTDFLLSGTREFEIPRLTARYGEDFVDLLYAFEASDATCVVVVDPADLIEEASEANNSATKEIQICLPDLMIDNAEIIISNATPELGEDVELTALLRNTGSWDATDFDVVYRADGVEFATREMAYFPVGASKEIKAEYLVESHGVVSFSVFADDGDVVFEESETNNVGDATAVFRAPDLIVSVPPAADQPVRVGRRTSLRATVLNRDDIEHLGYDLTAGVTETFSVTFYRGDPGVNGVAIGSATVAGLGEGDTAEVSVPWTPAFEGCRDIYAMVDPENLVRELYVPALTLDGDQNNKAFSEICIGADEPDLLFPQPSLDIILTATPSGVEIDPVAGVSAGTLVDVTASVTSANYFSNWVKLNIYDGDPRAELCGRLVDDLLLGYIPTDGTAAGEFLWDTFGRESTNQIFFVIDEPGHLAQAADTTGIVPSNQPLEIPNLDENKGISTDFEKGVDLVTSSTWTIEIFTTNDGVILDCTLGKYMYSPTLITSASYVDGATLEVPCGVLLKISSEEGDLPRFAEGHSVTLNVATIDKATTEYCVRVPLPDNSKGQYGSQLFLWVAEDGSSYFADRYHRSGQYNHVEPFVFGAIRTGTPEPAIGGFDDFTGTVFICGSDDIPPKMPMGMYKAYISINSGTPSCVFGEEANRENTCLFIISSTNDMTIAPDAYVTIPTAASEELKVALPELILDASEALGFWVALDGSTYYSDTSMTPVYVSGMDSNVGDYFDQTFWEAISPPEGTPERYLAATGEDYRLIGRPNLTPFEAMNDARGVVLESLESNNETILEVTVTGALYPDFEAFLVLSDASPEVGEPVHVIGTVDNHGADCTSPIEVLFYLEDAQTPSATWEISDGFHLLPHGLESGASASVEFDWCPEQAGDYNMVMSVDPNDLIMEGEAEPKGVYPNVARSAVSATPPAAYFVVSTFAVRDRVSVPTSEFLAGEKVYFEYYLENRGDPDIPRSFTFDGTVLDSYDYWQWVLEPMDLLAYGLGGEATTFVDTSTVWLSDGHEPGTYEIKANLYDLAYENGCAITQATASFDIVSPTGEPPVLLADVSTDSQVYFITENLADVLRISAHLANPSGMTTLRDVTWEISIHHNGDHLLDVANGEIAELKPGEHSATEHQVLISELINAATPPLDVYEVVLFGTSEVPGATAEGRTWFAIDSPILGATVEIADSSGIAKKVLGGTDTSVVSDVDALAGFGDGDWMTINALALRCWYGGGKNLVFDPGLDYDSDGDGIANGWEVSGLLTEATGVWVEENRIQEISGAMPQLFTDEKHDAFVYRWEPFTLSFDYQIASASGGLVVWTGEFDDAHNVLRTRWYGSDRVARGTAEYDLCWDSPTIECVELPLAMTSPFARRMRVGFSGIPVAGTQTLRIDNVQLERGEVATHWEDSEPNNLVVNGGFEQVGTQIDHGYYLADLDSTSGVMAGWDLSTGSNASYPDDEVSRSGSWSVRFQNPGGSTNQRFIEVIPDATYTLSLWTRRSGSYYLDADVYKFKYEGGQGGLPPPVQADITPSAVGEWEFFEIPFQTPDECRYVVLWIHGGGSGEVWLDDVQLERGSAATDCIRPLVYADPADWDLSEPDGCKEVYCGFMNEYGAILTDAVSDLALDVDGDGMFDSLFEQGSYNVYEDDLVTEITSFASGHEPSKMFDKDPGLGTSFALEGGSPRSAINIVIDLGSERLAEDLSIVLSDGITDEPVLYYGLNQWGWYPADYDLVSEPTPEAGFRKYSLTKLETFEGTALKERFYRLRVSSATPSTMEIKDIALKGYVEASVDTAILDRTPPVVEITSPEDGAVLASQPIIVEVTGVERYLSDVRIQSGTSNVEAAWGYMDAEAGIYEASASIGLVENATVTIMATATDVGGMSATDAIEVHVDTLAPTIVITTPEDEEVKPSQPVLVEATGVEIHLTSVWIISGTNEVEADWVYADAEAGIYEASASVSLTENEWVELNAVATDAVSLSATDSIDVFVDTLPPVPNDEIFDDTNFVDNCWNELSVDVVLEATDNITPATQIQFKLIGDVTPEYTDWTPMASAPASILLHPTTDEVKYATACYRDGLGNECTAVVDDVILDRTPPTVNIASPGSQSYHSGDTTVSATGEELGVGLEADPIEFRFVCEAPTDWANLNTLEDYTYSNVSGSYDGSGILDTETRPDGTNTLQLRVADRLANAATNEVSFTVDNDIPPAGPINLTAVAGGDRIYLDWQDNFEADLGGYKLYRSVISGTNYTSVADVGMATHYEDIHSATNNIVDQRQYYVVKAYDKAGNHSKTSNEANAYLQAADPPEPPIRLRAYSGDQYVDLYWDSDLNPNLVEYNLYRMPEGGNYSCVADQISSPTTTVYYHDDDDGNGLTNGNIYYYYVTAYYIYEATDESSRSNEVIGMPTGPVHFHIYELSVGMEDLKNQANVDWDFNDLGLVFDVTESLSLSMPNADIEDLRYYCQVTQRLAGHDKEVHVEFEVLSGTAEVRVERDSSHNPAISSYTIEGPTSNVLLIVADDGNDNDPGKYAEVTITSKSTDFRLKRWIPWFESLNTGEDIYPNVYGHPESAKQIVEDSSSPLVDWYLELVILIEDEDGPITFSPTDQVPIWTYYPDFVDYIKSGMTRKPYWYRNASE